MQQKCEHLLTLIYKSVFHNKFEVTISRSRQIWAASWQNQQNDYAPTLDP